MKSRIICGPTLLRNRAHVLHLFGIKGGLEAGKFSGSTGKQLLFHCEPQDCDPRRVEERTTGVPS